MMLTTKISTNFSISQFLLIFIIGSTWFLNDGGVYSFIIQTKQQQQQFIPWREFPLIDSLSYNMIDTSSQTRQTRTTQLYMNSQHNHHHEYIPDFDSTDPWKVLGINIGADIKDVKRAYKRLAMKYHPDITTNKDSTENEKKNASNKFAKINWAYEQLKNNDRQKSTATTGTGTSTTSTGWQPPHRRSGPSYTSSSSSSSSGYSSTDWRDYMPNYEKENYDTGGDSFEKIFSDMFKSAAASAAGYSTSGSGGGGIFKDFVEFLEKNVDGYGGNGGGNDDAELRILLQTGTVDDIGDEMDETELIVQQLTSKLDTIQNDIYQVQADIAGATRFAEKISMEEHLDELKARKSIVEGYIQKARKRLVTLQTRYKQLIINGQNDNRAGGKSTSSTWDDIRREATTTTSSSYSSSSRPSSRPSTSADYGGNSSRRSSTTTTTSSTSTDDNTDDSWKTEGFGSFGRRGSSSRGSRARRSRSSTTSASSANNNNAYDANRAGTGATSSTSSRYNNNNYNTSSSRSYNTSSQSSTSQSQQPMSYKEIPPHRRTQSTFQQQQENARRLREIKVDEEFDKLKKELGL